MPTARGAAYVAGVDSGGVHTGLVIGGVRHMSLKSASLRRGAVLIGAVVALGLSGAGDPSSARTFTKDTFHFSDPYSGAFSCDTFEGTYVGHDRGFVNTWYDSNGDPVRQQGHIYALETDTNESTGVSVVVRTQLNVHVDYPGGTIRLTGIRNLSHVPGKGVVIQSIGVRITDLNTDELIAVHGHADDVYADGGFCRALSG
jgi:hypothetical protein